VTDANGCLGCDIAAGRRLPPGGILAATPAWMVNHAVGSLNVGTLVVAPRQHITAVADLDPNAAAELGLILRAAALSLEKLCAPQQVYVCLWSHSASARKHLHFVVQPVTEELTRSFGGLRNEQLQAEMMRSSPAPPADEVAALCAMVKPVLMSFQPWT